MISSFPEDGISDLPLFGTRAEHVGGSVLLFHQNNPQVYQVLKTLAFRWKNARGSRVGIKMLFECARWEIGLQTKTDHDFTINNNHAPFYARLLMTNEPDLAGLFVLRQQRKQATIGPSNETLPSGEHVS